MPIKHDMSNKTWKEIDQLLHKIADRAAQIHDNEIIGDADMATALLRNIALELDIEDEESVPEGNPVLIS